MKNLRILLVEDNPINAKIASLLLKKMDHHVHHADNAPLAIQLIRDQNWDVVLMDLQMPDLDGVEATRQIRLTHPDLPIIALTANTMSEDHESCKNAGMNGFLAKPINTVLLREAIQSVLAEAYPQSQQKDLCPTTEQPPSKTDSSFIMSYRSQLGEEITRKLLDDFFSKTERLLIEMNAAVSCQDRMTLQRTLHTLKGATAQMGAIGFSELAASGMHLSTEAPWIDLENVANRLSCNWLTTRQEIENLMSIQPET